MATEIVITGISGRFPESDNVAEFSDNLYNKVDVLTDDDRRWEPGLYGLPKRMGKIKDISRFDATFFAVHPKQAHSLDPQARMLLEATYEAIVDAGYDPEELRGRRIGVYVGNCSSESDQLFCSKPKEIDGYGMTGCCRAMFANRISYTFDFKGPSFLIDTACSSGAFGMYAAVKAILNNECEAAIVGGANLCLRPATSLQFYKLNMLSDDGKCKSFDADCFGYGRSEAVVTVFLQKSDVARRSYASIVHIKTNTDGYKEQGVTFPSAEMQRQLIKEVYDECQVNPLDVSYVEAHGTGTKIGDPIEMSAISDIFCKNRNEPLLVGSVKSNMGHSEPSSGLCSLVKVIIGMEKGVIPPNLHFTTPNPEISALLNGHVKIVTDPEPWEGDYAALSCFGFGGVNVHALLKRNSKRPQLKEKCNSELPQLTLYCGRTKESVQTFLDFLDKETLPTRDFFALLHKSVYSLPLLKPFRCFRLLNGSQDVTDVEQVLEQRPVWYVFSGMGTQWPAMAKDLLKFDVFRRSVYKSAAVLEPYGIDLIQLITNAELKKEGERSIIPAFVSIAAVQVALVDVLTELGIKPDGIVGHSVGELGCAYADGCFTGEQMVLAAYWRGKAVEDSNLEEGGMAAIGLTWEEAQKLCHDNLFPSCHNAEDSVTVSGPIKGIKSFVENLKSQNIFAREVDSCGYAFHSQYIFPAAEKLQAALENVIPNPKCRSSRWVSSSVSQDKWNESLAKRASASYFVHNLVSPVLFHEALQSVPDNAIVIEIAPHHLLQAILKRVIGPNAKYVGLMKRNVDNAVHLLTSIGRLYNCGLAPDIEKLYPVVDFPVPCGTPMISSLIKWDHSDTWKTAVWGKDVDNSQMIVEVDISSEESEDSYLVGHCIDGRNLYPATGYLMLAWKALAEKKGKNIMQMPVIFEEVKINRATVLSNSAATHFLVDINSAGGDFEISESGMSIVTGRIYATEGTGDNQAPNRYQENTENGPRLDSDDIYKELRLRGYDYGPTFQGILQSDLEGNQGLLKWTGNWVVFLDNILQFSLLKSLKRALYLPTRIQKMKIDPILHSKLCEESQKTTGGIPIIHEKYTERCIAGGVEIKHLKASFALHSSRQSPLLEEYHFIPYNEKCVLSKHKQNTLEKYIHVCSSISKKILELTGKNKDQITDVMNGFKELDDDVISSYLKSIPDDHVLLQTLKDIYYSTLVQTPKASIPFVTNYLQECEKDVLSLSLLNEIPFRTLFDVATENISSNKIKVLEVSDGELPLTSRIQGFLKNHITLKVNYTIVHPNPSSVNKETLENVKIVQWNIFENPTVDMKEVDLLVVRGLKYNKKDFKKLLELSSSIVKPNGFILLLQKTHLVPGEMLLSALSDIVIPSYTESEIEHIFKTLNFQIISKKSDAIASSLYLLRLANDMNSMQDDVVIQVTEGHYEKWVDLLKTELSRSQSNSDNHRVWLLSEGNGNSGIVGLANCLRQEPGGSCLRCVFIDSNGKQKLPPFCLNNAAYKEIVSGNLFMNIYKSGSWGSFRHITTDLGNNNIVAEHAYINILTRGDLSSLKWVDSPLKHFSLGANFKDSVLCQVYYAPINFRDIMLASGKLPADAIPGNLVFEDCILGFEFSGRKMDGTRVMGVLPHQGMATAVAADPYFAWDVPDNWTLEEASTVPVAYSTAYYALVARGNLKKGEKILIHSGSGGVGQAAIAVALSLGCEVFTSVGSTEKKEFLKKRFPQLKDKNFCNSRDLSFEQHILNVTKGKGVNAVLNSLAEEKLKASLNCIAEHGKFLEIGKYDLSNNSNLGMAVFLKNISFHGILLDAIFGVQNRDMTDKQEIVNLVKEGIRNGTVKPLNSILFTHDQVEQAFRFMASGRHIGKVVIKIREEESQTNAIPKPMKVSAIPRTICNPIKTYIITGGLGGFGLELCQWLVERGARKIILSSRSGLRSGYQHLCMKRWKGENVHVEISNLNIAKLAEAEALLKRASAIGPIGGIFNLAMVLKDAFIENQTADNFKTVCEPKVLGTENLNHLSKKFCPELEWFVCFSSVSCGRGNAGQSNYGFANSVMERICESRRKEGLPGLAIQWGAVGDVGVVQDTLGEKVVIGGTIPQRIISCLSVLDQFIQHSHPVMSSFVPFQRSSTNDQKTAKRNVMATVANIFGIKDPSTMQEELTLGEMGVDSLMGVEIIQFLQRDYDLTLTVQELRQMRVKDLKKLDADALNDTRIGKSTEGSDKSEGEDFKNVGIKLNIGYDIKLSDYLFVPSETIIRMNDNKTGDPLFLVHPIEGVVTMLNTLGKFIKNPVYGLQCTTEAPSSSLQDLASWYLQHIRKLSHSETINLAGYSFGASVAFEMALQAEQNPGTLPSIKTLFMLEGNHLLVKMYAEEHESHFITDSQIEGEVQALCSFVLQYAQLNISKMKKDLFRLPNFEDRINFVANRISALCPEIPTEDISSAAHLYYQKLSVSYKYSPKSRLKKDIVLIKATETMDRMLNVSDAYDLEKICDGKIIVHSVNGTHKSYIQGKGAQEIAEIINSTCCK